MYILQENIKLDDKIYRLYSVLAILMNAEGKIYFQQKQTGLFPKFRALKLNNRC